MARWEQSIYQIDLLDPVLGGENGITNLPLLQLANRTLYLKKQAEYTQALVTPKSITANSANAVDAAGHSHEIALASTTTAGIVQLVDNLGSNANNQALTAKQGKVLNDTKLGNSGTQTLNGVLKITSGQNQWGKLNLPLQDGTQWWIEANPNYKTVTNGWAALRFLHIDGTTRRYYDLVKSSNNEVIAYHSWVQQGFVSKTTAETITGKKTFTDEIVSTSGGNALRLKNNRTNQSVFFRFDGNHFYLMKTATGDGDGTWDNTRPLVWNVATDSLSIKGNLNGNATTATKLHTPRNIAMTGDGSWNVNFDGTNNVSATLTLANTGVRAGSYNSVTVDAKGRVIAGLTQTHGLITATSATGTANTATNNSNTFLNIVASGVGQTASVGSSTQITGTNGISVSSDTAGKLIISQTIANNLKDTSGNKPLSANMGKVLKDELTALDGRKFEQRGALGLTDLNSLTAISHAGIWHQTDNINATTTRHYPTQKAGTLFVVHGTYHGQQLYFPYDEAVFYKRTTNAQGVYDNWMKIGGLADTLDSTSTNDALTANQGKILKEQIDTKVGKSGNETITGVKTFSSSPKAPTPPANSNDTTVATTAFVKREITNGFTYQKIGEFEIRKHPDGTMIQTYLFTATDNRLRDHEFQFNWAVGFAQKPKIFAQNTYKGVSWASIDTNTAIDYERTTQGKVVFRTSEIQYHGNKVEVEFMAIGRWK